MLVKPKNLKNQGEAVIKQLKDQISVCLREVVAKLEQFRDTRIKMLQQTKAPSQGLAIQTNEIKKVKCWCFVNRSDDTIFIKEVRVDPETLELNQGFPVGLDELDNVPTSYNQRNTEDIPVCRHNNKKITDKLLATVEVKSTSGFEIIVFEAHSYAKNSNIQTEKLICRRASDPGHDYFDYFPASASIEEPEEQYLHRIKDIIISAMQALDRKQYREVLDDKTMQALAAIKKVMRDNIKSTQKAYRYIVHLKRALTFFDANTSNVVTVKLNNLGAFDIKIAASYINANNFPLFYNMLSIMSYNIPQEYLICSFNASSGEFQYFYENEPVTCVGNEIRNQAVSIIETAVQLKKLLELFNEAAGIYFKDSTDFKGADQYIFTANFLFESLKKVNKDCRKTRPYMEKCLEVLRQINKNFVKIVLGLDEKYAIILEKAMLDVLYEKHKQNINTPLIKVIIDAMPNEEDFIKVMTGIVLNELVIDLKILQLESNKYYCQLQGHSLIKMLIFMMEQRIDDYNLKAHPNYTQLTIVELLPLIGVMAEKKIALDEVMITKFKTWLNEEKDHEFYKELAKIPDMQLLYVLLHRELIVDDKQCMDLIKSLFLYLNTLDFNQLNIIKQERPGLIFEIITSNINIVGLMDMPCLINLCNNVSEPQQLIIINYFKANIIKSLSSEIEAGVIDDILALLKLLTTRTQLAIMNMFYEKFDWIFDQIIPVKYFLQSLSISAKKSFINHLIKEHKQAACEWLLSEKKTFNLEQIYAYAKNLTKDFYEFFGIMGQACDDVVSIINVISTDPEYVRQLVDNNTKMIQLFEYCLQANNFCLIKQLGDNHFSKIINNADDLWGFLKSIQEQDRVKLMECLPGGASSIGKVIDKLIAIDEYIPARYLNKILLVMPDSIDISKLFNKNIITHVITSSGELEALFKSLAGQKRQQLAEYLVKIQLVIPGAILDLKSALSLLESKNKNANNKLVSEMPDGLPLLNKLFK